MFFKLILASILILNIGIINVHCAKCFVRFAWQRHCGTWNMQGAQEQGLSSWSRLSGVLGRSVSDDEDPINVMAIQEAGEAPPHTARPTQAQDQPPVSRSYGPHSGDITDRVVEYEWPTGSTSRPGPTYYLYHCTINTQLEEDGGRLDTQRTNLAILSLQRAHEVRLFRLDTQFRPVLCIRIGTSYFCSIHANVRFNQAPRTIVSLENEFSLIAQARAIQLSWMIMGDFNREPVNGINSLRNRIEPVNDNLSRQIVIPIGPTQQSGGTLDYAIAGGTGISPPILIAELDTRLVSDHTSVRFSQLHLNPNTPRPDPQAPEAPQSSTWLAAVGTTIAVIAGTILSGGS